MSSPATVFRRPPGDGWLWLAGSFRDQGAALTSPFPEIEKTIGRPRQAVILTATAAGAPDLSGLRQWMVPNVQAHTLASPVFPSLAAIELALLIGDDLDAWLDGFGDSEAEDLLLEGLGRGMHILAAGAAAEVVGSWAWSPRGEEYVGALGWLPGAIVMTGEAATGDWGPSRSVLARRRRAYALAVAPGNLVGLGPRGEVRLSGDPAPKLLLGPGWGAAEEGAGRRPSSLERP